MDFLAELRQSNINRNQKWDPDNRLDSTFKALELCGEVGEVANIVKKLKRQAMGLVGSKTNIKDLEDELADVLICLDMLANYYNIDLEEVTRAKFNETSHKVGFDVFL